MGLKYKSTDAQAEKVAMKECKVDRVVDRNRELISLVEKRKYSTSFLGICKVAVLFHKFNRTMVFKYVVFVLSVVVKNVSNMLGMTVLEKLDTKDATAQKNTIFLSTAFILMTHTLNFVLDYVFEEWLGKYGGEMSVEALKSILNANDVRVNELNSAKTGYCISEGSKAMAKVSSNILNDIPSKLVHLACDSFVIYMADESKNKMCFIVFMSGSLILTLMKVVSIYQNIRYIKRIARAGAERDKIVQETLDRMDIIKGYNVDDEYLKYATYTCKRWVKSRKPYKLHLFSGELFYKTLTVLFRLIVCIIFISRSKGVSALKVALLIKILMDTVKTLEKASEIITKMVESVGEAEQILDYLYLMQENRDLKFKPTDFKHSVEVKNVRFNVSGGRRTVFDNVSLQINPMEKIVMCGKNGTGKSSLFKILLNQVEYTGNVFYDSVDSRSIDRRSLNSLVTSVPQNTVLMNGTILYNIKLHNKDVSYDDVVEICRELNIHDTIMKFPSRYNTEVGEGGRNINGGLRQKIFYARAFLRDTPIYLFDEPTNNLDDEHAQQFINYILTSSKLEKKTIFVICHDVELISRFPLQYKFEESKIVKIN